jgi:hypothetical protein
VKTVTDPNRIEKNRIRFLEALYQLATESGHDPLQVAPLANVIGERAKLDASETRRAHTDLKADGLIRYMASGPLCCLTKKGREFIEEHLFKKTARGKMRAVKEKSKILAKAGASKAVVYFGGLMSGWISAAGAFYFRPILDAVKHWVGLK